MLVNFFKNDSCLRIFLTVLSKGSRITEDVTIIEYCIIQLQ